MAMLPAAVAEDTNSGQQRGHGRGGFRSRGRGGGGYQYQNPQGGHNNSQEGSGYGGYGYGYGNQATDAVVLGGDTTTDSSTYDNGNYSYDSGISQTQNQMSSNGSDAMQTTTQAQSPRSSGGKMQRVGDRWVWQPANPS